MRGSGRPGGPLMRDDADVDERLDDVRRRMRLWAEKDERELRVDELGVDGLISEGALVERGR